MYAMSQEFCMSLSSRYPQLQTNPLFSHLTPDQQAGLQEQAEVVSLARGQSFHEQGDNARRFGFVLSGSLKLYRLTQDGQEKVFRILSSGDSLAEGMLFAITTEHNYTAKAIESSEAVMFPIELYREIALSNTEITVDLLSQLAQMEQDSLETLEILSFKKSIDRVVRYLLCQVLKSCQRCNAPQFELPASKRLIASQLSIQPETLSRVLNQMEREGVLLLEGRRICILDLAKLLTHE